MTHSSQIVLLALVAGLAVPSAAQAEALESFAILGGSTITNTGISTISGNIGLWPGSAATGMGDAGANHVVLTNGVLHINDAVAIQAQSDLTTAFNVLMGRPSTSNLTGQTLGDLGTISALDAGVYTFDSSAQLTGQLTLNGTADDIFIFQISSTLTTSPGSSIILGGDVQAANVFWVVGSSATLDTTTAFQGQILALTSITLNTAATISCGAAWARNGAVTLDTNTIGICVFEVPPDVIGEPDDGGGTGGEPGGGTGGGGTPGTGGTPYVPPDNGTAAQGGIRDFILGGGTVPLSFALLGLLTPEELAQAFRELGGEIGTAATPTAFQATNSYLDIISSRLNGSPGTLVISREGMPDDNTVSVMGYAAAPGTGLDQFAGIDSQPMPSVSEWTIWGGPFGSTSIMHGKDTVGTHTVSASDYGFALGFDRHVSADTLFGFSLAGGGTNYNLDDSLGSGKSAMLEAAIYGRQEIDQAYITGILSYARQQNTTRRVVNLGGANLYRGDFASDGGAASVEAGYQLGWFTPYAGVRGQVVSTAGYTETTTSGSDMYGLTYDPKLALSARTEIGARFDWSNEIEGGTVTLSSSIAWAHNLTGPNISTASFTTLGSASEFNVVGATPARDALLLAAGIGAQFDGGLELSGAVNGSISANTRSYGASVRVGYSW